MLYFKYRFVKNVCSLSSLPSKNTPFSFSTIDIELS